MNAETTDSTRQNLFDSAAASLTRGGLVAYPTEAVWGLGCDPFSESATERLIALKQRQPEKGLIVIASHIKQLDFLIQKLPAQLQRKLSSEIKTRTTSGGRPTTWLIPHYNSFPVWITGAHETIAVRITAHAIAHNLCQHFGRPIVSTSANPSGMAPAKTRHECEAYFGSEVDVYLTGETGAEAQPSAIIDLVSGRQLR